jgi:hypothetical protein
MIARQRAERGQGIVEFAVVFPLFVMLIFVMIDGGLLMGRYSQVHHGVNEGARLGSLGADKDDIIDRVVDQSQGLVTSSTQENCGTRTDEVCVKWYDGPNGEDAGEVGSRVRVAVHYHYYYNTPLGAVLDGVTSDHFSVDACAISTLERPNPNLSSGDTEGGDPEC